MIRYGWIEQCANYQIYILAGWKGLKNDTMVMGKLCTDSPDMLLDAFQLSEHWSIDV